MNQYLKPKRFCIWCGGRGKVTTYAAGSELTARCACTDNPRKLAAGVNNIMLARELGIIK